MKRVRRRGKCFSKYAFFFLLLSSRACLIRLVPLQETRRISALLRPAPAQIALPPTSSAPTFDFGSSTADVNSGLPDLTFPFLFPGETAGTQVDAYVVLPHLYLVETAY